MPRWVTSSSTDIKLIKITRAEMLQEVKRTPAFVAVPHDKTDAPKTLKFEENWDLHMYLEERADPYLGPYQEG